MILVLIPLKLLQAKQEALINKFSRKKAMILNEKNNQKDIQLEIAKKNILKYLQALRSLSKKFKKNVLDNSQFTDCLCLLTIDEIHLVEKWNKGFWLLYSEIEKV